MSVQRSEFLPPELEESLRICLQEASIFLKGNLRDERILEILRNILLNPRSPHPLQAVIWAPRVLSENSKFLTRAFEEIIDCLLRLTIEDIVYAANVAFRMPVRKCPLLGTNPSKDLATGRVALALARLPMIAPSHMKLIDNLVLSILDPEIKRSTCNELANALATRRLYTEEAKRFRELSMVQNDF